MLLFAGSSVEGRSGTVARPETPETGTGCTCAVITTVPISNNPLRSMLKKQSAPGVVRS